MLITKQIEFDMGHRIQNHKSKCCNIHGHRYKVEVGVDDKVIKTKGKANEGMVIDFGDLKNIMMETIDWNLDHNSMYCDEDPIKGFLQACEEYQLKDIIFVPFIPTAENIAKYIFEMIQPRLKEKGIKLSYVKLWETPTSTATYEQH